MKNKKPLQKIRKKRKIEGENPKTITNKYISLHTLNSEWASPNVFRSQPKKMVWTCLHITKSII